MNAEQLIHTIPYLVQIVILVAGIYMIWRARRLLNGLARGLILLFVFLIAQRLDFSFDVYNEDISLIVSSLVVIAVAHNVYQFYKMLPIYQQYWTNRQARINEYEQMRANAERGMPWDKQPVSRV
jgi:hypothetical protein